jgi:phosphatidylserine/phosphatidylglycerophosphate/cardiolipin synthase-like enzyme
MEWGIEFKTYRPPVGHYSAMHPKSWVCDGEVYLGGSVNFTSNGVNRNEEHLLIIKDEEVVTTYLEWFERLWFAGRGVVART